MKEVNSHPLRFSILFVAALFILTSCSTTKYLREGETLHQKTKVNFVNPEAFDDRSMIKKDVNKIARPKPNNKLKLRFYNFMGVPKRTKGLFHWLGTRFGEAPRLYDPVLVRRSEQRINRYLKNMGYFESTVVCDTIRRGNKMKVSYLLQSSGRYAIGTSSYPQDTIEIAQLIRNHQSGSFISPGEPYHIEDLDAERKRLTAIAQNNGFIQFEENDIFFIADTSKNSFTADLYMSLRSPRTQDAYNKYYIGETWINPNYNLRYGEEDRTHYEKGPGGFNYVQNTRIIRERNIERHLPQRRGDYYSKALHDVSLSRLKSLGIFKFVNITYKKDTTSLQNNIDRFVHLTPGKMQDISGSIELNSQTGNYYGTSAGITYAHKNLFGGAERLNLGLTANLATEFKEDATFINTSNFEIKAGISIPRLITPFRVRHTFNPIIPRTLLSTGITFEKRINFYSVQSAELKIGYRWQKSALVEHEFFPVSFSSFRVTDSSPEFQQLKDQNPRLARSFENVITGGLKYTYIATSRILEEQKNQRYFMGELETSGNLMYLFSLLSQKESDEPFRLGGLPVSQFVKFNADFRQITNYGKTHLVLRLNSGIAVAYGNSEDVPYNRQFTVGGANSMRAFPLRGLGPGNFVRTSAGNQEIDNQFLDQTGNLKLELNIEYRFPILGYLKGAAFIDGGNIWLLRNQETPEGIFRLDSFIKEIAVGTGVGIRLDFNYFVLRLDTSFPLRQPKAEEGFVWTFGDIDLLSRQWRKENLAWHLAIGYPF